MPPPNELVIDLTIPTPPQSPAPEYQLVIFLLHFLWVFSYNDLLLYYSRERDENDDCEDLYDHRGSNYCDCLHDPPSVICLLILFSNKQLY